MLAPHETTRRASRRASRPGAVRRRWLVVLLFVLGLGLGTWGASGSRSRDRVPALSSTPQLVIKIGGRTLLRTPVSRYIRAGRLDRRALAAVIERSVPESAVARRRRSYIAYRYDRQATLDRVIATGRTGGTVEAVRHATAARADAPVVRQAQRNTCESAALEILLGSTGANIDQRRLQRAFPRSGPLDPTGDGPNRVWGDPQLGYVGRADGGGTAGGFGIYPAPVRATAERFGVALEDISGQSSAVYARLLEGRAVMAWVGLSDGPYGQWRSPQGKVIKVNFGEHTVVLYGLRRDGRLEVSNPLQGTREFWTKSQFEAMWQLLGRRALAA